MIISLYPYYCTWHYFVLLYGCVVVRGLHAPHLYPFIVDRRLGHLHVLATVSSGAMSMEMHVSFWIIVLLLMKVAVHFSYTLPLTSNLKNLSWWRRVSVFWLCFSPRFCVLLRFCFWWWRSFQHLLQGKPSVDELLQLSFFWGSFYFSLPSGWRLCWTEYSQMAVLVSVLWECHFTASWTVEFQLRNPLLA